MKMNGKYLGYGMSGDYSFGRVPAYVKQKYFGNIRAAEDVFSQFIKEYKL